MGNFKFIELDIKGLYLIEPKIYGDERGYNMETYHAEAFKAAGLTMNFVQNNQSLSKKGVLRGLHYQKTHPQGKLVSVLKGEVFDVAVDLRSGSPTYGKWYGEILSYENKRMLYVPEGFAHGFYVLSEEALFSYQLTDFYHPEDEGGIIWNDPDIAVNWPIEAGTVPTISDKDNNLPEFKYNKIEFDR
ncbi:dTDP-4-dehydrorhamnose 3,5-epimerase [Mobilitalea sibirica]|uniref:dTDP-4-dehydrorhamnose 3,5-epimerase n=1 Tax=Mobilitalea sibirica TaxID=1462919 RepID=A0A8J7HBX7_9FIRM|nr:dTDP-4-dehydrorhamnose 3,5-epimerase [Mobilitalea sibirica]MBH1941591.1 dTDP-4-dehydrorhamnose 3,5-epimerase [Mobilitalea sibirica]